MYQIADSTGDLGISEDGFPNRELARLARNAVNDIHNSRAKTPGGKPRFVICRGEDHPRGATDGNDHTARSKWL